MIAGCPLAPALLVVIGIGVICLFGYLFTFLQAYAIFFLGGRYPLMGQLLTEPPAPVMPAAQPQLDARVLHAAAGVPLRRRPVLRFKM